MINSAKDIVLKLSSSLSDGGSSPYNGFQILGGNFADNYNNDFGYNSDYSSIISELGSIGDSGVTTNLTAGLLGIEANLTGSLGARPVNKKILVFTDGDPNSEVSASNAAAAIHARSHTNLAMVIKPYG